MAQRRRRPAIYICGSDTPGTYMYEMASCGRPSCEHARGGHKDHTGPCDCWKDDDEERAEPCGCPEFLEEPPTEEEDPL